MKYFLLFMLIPLSIFANPINSVLGMPISNDSLILVEREEFTSAVKCEYGVPLWVSYNLNKNWFGDVARWSGNFIVDSLEPNTCWIKHADYTNSGYDRGHMVRSEERTKTVDANKATFRTSNIIPQLPELNQQTWLKLEYYCEKLAKDSLKDMYIMDGPVFTNNVRLYGKIAIPDSCYKIIVVMPFGSTLKDVDVNTQIIAVMMPNNDKDVKNHDWTEYKTTINHIEQSTGIDFLTALPISLQDRLEGRVTGVDEAPTSNIIIYPNPATNYIFVPSVNFTIFNRMGIEIGTFKENRIDISNWENGVYFVKTDYSLSKFIKI